VTNEIIRVFVATQEPQMLSFKILEYSIKKHASMPVEVRPLHLSGIECPVPADPVNRQKTPFSFQRFMIPEVVGHHGRAIYMDSDMQVFSDLAEVWCVDMKGHDVLYCEAKSGEGRSEQFSVLLLDCERLNWNVSEIVGDLDAQRYTYADLMSELCIAKSKAPMLPCYWNSLEFYRSNETALLHYTDMQTQPWVDIRNPLSGLWFQTLFEAVGAGDISMKFINEHILNGWIRPSLRYQIDNSIADSRSLASEILKEDRGFFPPYKAIRGNSSLVSLMSCSENIKRIIRIYRRIFS